jgi:hypothetical protein
MRIYLIILKKKKFKKRIEFFIFTKKLKIRLLKNKTNFFFFIEKLYWKKKESEKYNYKKKNKEKRAFKDYIHNY